MMLDRLVFDHMDFPPRAVTVGCVRAKASVLPYLSYDDVMHIVVKGGVLDFIGLVLMKNIILLCESHRYWF